MTIGQRLREERKRLGFTQPKLGEVTGVIKGTQIAYEKDERSPDTKYLAAAAKSGVDVLYVITGERVSHLHKAILELTDQLQTAKQCTQEERALLDKVRQAQASGQAIYIPRYRPLGGKS